MGRNPPAIRDSSYLDSPMVHGLEEVGRVPRNREPSAKQSSNVTRFARRKQPAIVRVRRHFSIASSSANNFPDATLEAEKLSMFFVSIASSSANNFPVTTPPRRMPRMQGLN